MSNKSMKFLLLPKEGKPRFSSKDPWEYIKSKGMKPVKDYFNFYYEIDLSDCSPIHSLCFTDNPYGIIYFNKDGIQDFKEEENKESLNSIATSFYNAYGAVYEENKQNIYSDALVVKTYDFKSLEDIDNQDVKKLRRMLQDAIKWF